MLARIKALKARTVAIVAVLSAALVLTGAGVASALVTNATGTFSDRQYFATNDVAWTVPAATPSGAWVSVPGMTRTITVPAGTSRLLDARFTAESSCIGGSWCSARIVYVTPTGAIVELAPASGTDYAFDSPGGETWEGNAMERSSPTFLPPGTYRVVVQAAKIGAVISYRLDDMHFVVEAVRP